jgi:2-dehydropantoate 2-reductase
LKIVVVGGTGALGGVWAAALYAAGHDVTILGANQTTVDGIARDGLMIEEAGRPPHHVTIPATTGAAIIGPADVAILLTKAHQTRAAIERALPAIGPETTVLTLQNGWGHAGVLAEYVGPAQLLVGVTYRGGTMLAPGRVLQTLTTGATFIGPYLDGAPLDRARVIGEAMGAAGIATTVTAEVNAEIWKKLILNAAGVTIAALTRLPTGAMAGRPGLEQLAAGLIAEGVAVANALGFALDAEERTRTLVALWGAGGSGRASMLQDVEARRPTEIAAINGAIVREGEARGIPVPLNRAMVALIQGMEASWR